MNKFFSLRSSVILSLLGSLIGIGFLVTTLASFYTSRASLRQAIITTELPLISNAVYSDIRNDLIRPVQISRAMASDVFLHEWIDHGEQDVKIIARFLTGIRSQYGTTSAFFVSDRTHIYYDQGGIFEHLDPGRESSAWFYRFRDGQQPWEVIIDRGRSSLFINFRVLDAQGNFQGVAGVGITLAVVLKMIDSYQRRYDRAVYFIDNQRNLVLAGEDVYKNLIRATPIDEVSSLKGLSHLLSPIKDGTYDYNRDGEQHFVNVRHIDELNWFLLVDKHDSGVMVPVWRTLWINLLVCLCVTVIVLGIIGWMVRRYLQRIEDLVILDPLTNLLNRRGFSVVAEQALLECRRNNSPLCILFLDLDHFKLVNDKYGHLGGDWVLKTFAGQLKRLLRASDIVSRWGGEEFVVVLQGTPLDAAQALAEKIRVQTQASVIEYEGAQLRISVSIGIACLHLGESLEGLLGRADQALYRAKHGGRNQICISEGSLVAITKQV
jgi:diguanylate cyclase (GGDEF)-like protein